MWNLMILIHQRNEGYLCLLRARVKTAGLTSVSEEELTVMAKKQMSKNTEKSSKWAITNLLEWYTDYNERNKDNTCPEEVITSNCSKELLNKWLCVYISGVARENCQGGHGMEGEKGQNGARSAPQFWPRPLFSLPHPFSVHFADLPLFIIIIV